MLQVGDRVLLPPHTEIRSIRYRTVIRGPRAGLVTKIDPVRHEVQIQWDHIPAPVWLAAEIVQGRCRKVEVGMADNGQHTVREAVGRASSIPEALEQLGFRVDEGASSFARGKMKIPFTALAGHTVQSFLKWLDDQEQREEQGG